jgi:D-glycero-alpha-D-manno-heptose-7-phosphate kinase
MILVRTPFRLPLGGGGTDLPAYYQKFGGYLITGAINKYMFISINQPALVDRIKVKYSKSESVGLGELDQIQHDIARETLRYLGIDRPIEITSTADLSAGTGMGSSGSYAVGLLNGLNCMLRRHVSVHDLAEQACKVEMELANKPVGKQDQFAAAFGGIKILEIDQSGKVTVSTLDLEHEIVNELENRLMMFYTHVERDASEILAEQGKKVTADESAATNSMHRIKEIGAQSATALKKGDITGFGKLMHEHWAEKKKISSKMSMKKIDEYYETAMKYGALGGKIMGAGGGGFMVFCIEAGRRKEVRTAMEKAGLRYMDFKFDWNGSTVLVNV